MDARLPSGAPLHHKVNGGGARSPRPNEQAEALRFLSQEEQECLQFFEDTIESLEDSLDEDERRGGGRAPTQTDGPGPAMSPPQGRTSSPKNQDIIDLVHPEPDLVPSREPVFNPSSPDFQSLMATAESHFEIRPRRDAAAAAAADGLPPEYNPPLPSGSYGPSEGLSSYHPPGCIPTPVLIAQKIAENQSGGTSAFNPSALLRRCSLDSEKPASGATTPPPSARPARFPANISLVLGSKELHNQSLPSVNLQERRAQMLANLSGGSHPLEEPPPPAEPLLAPPPQQPRNVPTRSVSFRDPTPDKSRMEALSKLGLTRSRASSGGGGALLPDTPPPAHVEAKPPAVAETRPPRAEPHSHQERQPVARSDTLKSQELPPDLAAFPPPPPPPPAEVTSLEFNSYGGKSIVVQPSKTEPASPPGSPEPEALPPPPPPAALAAPSEFNSYGGKTKVMTPAPAPMTRSNLPDILSSHIDKSQAPPPRPEPLPTELNSYGGRSRTFNPSAKTLKAPAPPPAPKPARHSYHGGAHKPAPRAPSPEIKRRPASMFRPQSITVQFSGRGATDESRREALRKLGLLKDS